MNPNELVRRKQNKKLRETPGPVGQKTRKNLLSTRVKPGMYSEAEMDALIKAQEKRFTAGEKETLESKMNRETNQRKLNAFRMQVLDLVAANFPDSKQVAVREKAGNLLKQFFLKKIEEGKSISEIIREPTAAK
ncbi:MAG: hypothetical protein QXO69_00910 [archaeon]